MFQYILAHLPVANGAEGITLTVREVWRLIVGQVKLNVVLPRPLRRFCVAQALRHNTASVMKI